MINQVVFQGRFTRDPEVQHTQSGVSRCRFSVAWSERYKETETTCFLTCTAWRSTADMIGRYFRKGQECVIEGRLETNKYTDKNGNQRSDLVCTVNRIHFCGPKSDGSGSAPTTAADEGGFMDIPDSEELPYS